MPPTLTSRFFLTAASDYESMFAPFLKLLPGMKPEIDSQIAWAKRVLKKQNRIVWYLRWIRLWKVTESVEDEHLLSELRPPAPNNSDGTPAPVDQKQTDFIAKLKVLAEQYRREAMAKLPSGATDHDVRAYNSVASFKSELEHFFSTPDPGIQAYDPGYTAPRKAILALHELEAEFKERARGTISPKTEDKIFIDCGGGWAWWHLPRAACDDESKAMGHCGNSPAAGKPGISILSLRNQKKVGKEVRWEPHLTFIYHSIGDDAGTLGEMKGKGNDKPVPRYHPYIVKLLEDPRIQGIDGGGYKPKNNFAFDDLTEEEQEQVREINPAAAMTLDEYLDQYGSEDEVSLARIAAKLGIPNKTTYEGFVIRQWKDQDAFLNKCGDEDSQQLSDYLSGGKLGYFVDNLLKGVGSDDSVWTLIANQIKAEYPNAGLTEDPERLADSVKSFLNEVDYDEESPLQQKLEQAFVDASDHKTYGGRQSAHEVMQEIMDDAEQNCCEDTDTRIENDGGICQTVDFDTAEFAARNDRSIRQDEPSVCIYLRFSDIPAHVSAAFGEITQNKKRLEEQGQERLFPRPKTKADAERNGIKHSHLKLTSHLFTAASDYESMFSAVLDLDPLVKPRVDKQIQWARQNLKKSNRITWYLRWARIAILGTVVTDHTLGAQAKVLLDKYQKEMQVKSGTTDQGVALGGLNRIQHSLEHYFALESPAIQNFDPGYMPLDDALEQLGTLEKSYIEERKGTLTPKTGDYVYLDCGGGWAWWHLPRASCSDEAGAMGHCGNSPEGRRTDRSILSLRQEKKVGNKQVFEPHLTFIFQNEKNDLDHGFLGEMKGKGNAKPAPKYHPYIVKLLEDHRVEGIMGGGYLLAHNFTFSDLTEEEQAAVRKANPDATWTFRESLEKKGIDMDEMVSQIGLNPTNTVTLPTGDIVYVIEEWDNMNDLVRYNGDDSAKELQGCIDGNMALFSDHLLNLVEPEVAVFQGIAKQIEREFSGQSFDLESDTLVKDVIDTVRGLDDEGESVLREGLEEAFITGWGWNNTKTLKDIMGYAMSEAVDVYGYGYAGTLSLVPGRYWDTYVYYATEEEVVEIFNKRGVQDEPMDISEWERPSLSPMDLEDSDMSDPAGALGILEDFFENELFSPKKLERAGQERLFERPKTKEDAERDGIKHSNLRFTSPLLLTRAA
jgi:hypothetical protein